MTIKHQFDLGQNEYVALCDLLKLCAVVGSGGQAKQVIAAGEVLRNGVCERRKTAKIVAGDQVVFGLEVIEVVRKNIYDGQSIE